MTPFQRTVLERIAATNSYKSAEAVASLFKGISRRTIQRQLQALRQMGYLDFNRRRGWTLTESGKRTLSTSRR